MSATQHSVTAPLAYLAHFDGPAEHLVYPPSSGRKLVRPPLEHREMPIADCRSLSALPRVDEAGFELLRHVSAMTDFYDDIRVREHYYAEVIALLKQTLGAVHVVAFDHNQRSAARAARGQIGVRTPVDAAHSDYTPISGPKRAREILAADGNDAFNTHRLALINVWRPIIGPVRDVPLAVCDARSTRPEDFIDTAIHHFGEDDLEHPRHSGSIYSVRYNPAHRWYFVADMQPDEVLLLKNWDSATDCARFAPHTGFKNPTAPPDCIPRESIEVRTLVVYP